MTFKVYLAGEIHSNWREEIATDIQDHALPIEVLTPITDHNASDGVGARILGPEENAFWNDRKAAGINSLRIRTGIEHADIVVVKFGEKYRQWNAAFDAGYAVAKGRSLIVIHPEEYNHALKEIDAAAVAVCSETGQTVEILKYLAGTAG